MVSVSFFEVTCQSYVRFSRCVACDICNVVCKALSFEGHCSFFLQLHSLTCSVAGVEV